MPTKNTDEIVLDTYKLARETKNFYVYATEPEPGDRPQTQYVPKEAFDQPPAKIEVVIRPV